MAKTSKTSQPAADVSLADLAGAAKADRNRAVDFYRGVAMCCVAIGHWAAIAVYVDDGGGLVAKNALEINPSIGWVSWLLQVMPLFFVVGGFSSAMSLDSHNKNGGRAQDWVAGRLRRMLAPTVILAIVWVVALAVAYAVGREALIITGAASAAIPLWFLANYTIDTAIAPHVLPRFRKNPALFAVAGIGVFLFLESLRFVGVPWLPELNWVLGWLLFQVAGFAWRDQLLPTGLKLLGVAAGFWALAFASVTVGPYPTSMVHFPGIGDLSPTHPPSLALMLFGAAYSATALSAAPAISKWLARDTKTSKRAWSATVAANSFAMSVYLWHFSAAVAASGLMFLFGGLPTADVGTGSWWLQKLPLMGVATIILAVIVALVAKYERAALLGEKKPWVGNVASMIVVAAVLSTSIKLWASADVGKILFGTITTIILWFVFIDNPGRVFKSRTETSQQK